MKPQHFLASVGVALSLMTGGFALANPPLQPAGVVSIEETQFGFILGGSVGGGVLTIEGKKHPFQIGGLSLGANIGVSKVAAKGEIYNLKRLEDFPGTYVVTGGNVALGGGVGGMQLRNQNGVIMRLQSTSEGLQFNVGASGVSVFFEKK